MPANDTEATPLFTMASFIVCAQVQSVNARELHGFLRSGDKFATWIKSRVEQYGFVEGMDFATYSENAEKGRPRIEYAISLDMAKELSMVERTAKGKQARQFTLARLRG